MKQNMDNGGSQCGVDHLVSGRPIQWLKEMLYSQGLHDLLLRGKAVPFALGPPPSFLPSLSLSLSIFDLRLDSSDSRAQKIHRDLGSHGWSLTHEEYFICLTQTGCCIQLLFCFIFHSLLICFMFFFLRARG